MTPLLAAPRIFAAARAAGASLPEAAGALRVSAAALTAAASASPRKPGRRNAQRHFTWQAVLSAHYGEAVARAIGEAHERGSTRPEDTAVDRHNNAVGRDYGVAHAEQLRSMGVSRAARHLCGVAVPLWRSGELHVVERTGG